MSTVPAAQFPDLRQSSRSQGDPLNSKSTATRNQILTLDPISNIYIVHIVQFLPSQFSPYTLIFRFYAQESNPRCAPEGWDGSRREAQSIPPTAQRGDRGTLHPQTGCQGQSPKERERLLCVCVFGREGLSVRGRGSMWERHKVFPESKQRYSVRTTSPPPVCKLAVQISDLKRGSLSVCMCVWERDWTWFLFFESTSWRFEPATPA